MDRYYLTFWSAFDIGRIQLGKNLFCVQRFNICFFAIDILIPFYSTTSETKIGGRKLLYLLFQIFLFQIQIN